MNVDFDTIAVRDCEFSVRTANIIADVYGPAATLGDVVRGGGVDRLLQEKGFGRRCAREVRDMLDGLRHEARRRAERRRSVDVAGALESGALRVVTAQQWADYLRLKAAEDAA